MKASPLIRYREPRYPTKLRVLADPELLRHRVPAAWMRQRELAAAIALSLSASGCFLFDDGMSGCVTIIPPVYLTEEQALAIIVDQAAKGGLALSTDPTLLAAMELPIEEDAVDLPHNVAIEFVSKDDCIAYQPAPEDGGVVDANTRVRDAQPYDRTDICSDGWGYSLYGDIAQDIYNGVKTARPDVNFKAIADPQETTLEYAEEDLRQQVTEFVDWLRSIGAI